MRIKWNRHLDVGNATRRRSDTSEQARGDCDKKKHSSPSIFRIFRGKRKHRRDAPDAECCDEDDCASVSSVATVASQPSAEVSRRDRSASLFSSFRLNFPGRKKRSSSRILSAAAPGDHCSSPDLSRPGLGPVQERERQSPAACQSLRELRTQNAQSLEKLKASSGSIQSEARLVKSVSFSECPTSGPKNVPNSGNPLRMSNGKKPAKEIPESLGCKALPGDCSRSAEIVQSLEEAVVKAPAQQPPVDVPTDSRVMPASSVPDAIVLNGGEISAKSSDPVPNGVIKDRPNAVGAPLKQQDREKYAVRVKLKSCSTVQLVGEIPNGAYVSVLPSVTSEPTSMTCDVVTLDGHDSPQLLPLDENNGIDDSAATESPAELRSDVQATPATLSRDSEAGSAREDTSATTQVLASSNSPKSHSLFMENADFLRNIVVSDPPSQLDTLQAKIQTMCYLLEHEMQIFNSDLFEFSIPQKKKSVLDLNVSFIYPELSHCSYTTCFDRTSPFELIPYQTNTSLFPYDCYSNHERNWNSVVATQSTQPVALLSDSLATTGGAILNQATGTHRYTFASELGAIRENQPEGFALQEAVGRDFDPESISNVTLCDSDVTLQEAIYTPRLSETPDNVPSAVKSGRPGGCTALVPCDALAFGYDGGMLTNFAPCVQNHPPKMPPTSTIPEEEPLKPCESVLSTRMSPLFFVNPVIESLDFDKTCPQDGVERVIPLEAKRASLTTNGVLENCDDRIDDKDRSDELDRVCENDLHRGIKSAHARSKIPCRSSRFASKIPSHKAPQSSDEHDPTSAKSNIFCDDVSGKAPQSSDEHGPTSAKSNIFCDDVSGKAPQNSDEHGPTSTKSNIICDDVSGKAPQSCDEHGPTSAKSNIFCDDVSGKAPQSCDGHELTSTKSNVIFDDVSGKAPQSCDEHELTSTKSNIFCDDVSVKVPQSSEEHGLTSTKSNLFYEDMSGNFERSKSENFLPSYDGPTSISPKVPSLSDSTENKRILSTSDERVTKESQELSDSTCFLQNLELTASERSKTNSFTSEVNCQDNVECNLCSRSASLPAFVGQVQNSSENLRQKTKLCTLNSCKTKSRIPTKQHGSRGAYHSAAKPARPPLWLSKAELTQEIQHLGNLCETRTKELNRLKMQTKHATVGFDAFAALLRYLVEDMNALSVPKLAKDLDKTLKQLELAKQDLAYYEREVEEMKAHHCQELNDLSNKLFEVYQAEVSELTTKHQEELSKINMEHQQQVENMSAAFGASSEEIKTQHEKLVQNLEQELIKQREEFQMFQEREIKDLEERHTQSTKVLREHIEQLQKKCDELKQHSMSMEDAMRKDTDSKLQWVTARKVDLEKEVESLKTVLEMKNKELHSLRVQNLEMEKQLEELPFAREKIKMLQARAEDLEALMVQKTKLERKLSTENQLIRDTYEKETKMNKRLSMENEELQWRLRQAEQSLISDSLNENEPEDFDNAPTSSPAKSPASHVVSRSVFFTFIDKDESSPNSPRSQYKKITPNFSANYKTSPSKHTKSPPILSPRRGKSNSEPLQPSGLSCTSRKVTKQPLSRNKGPQKRQRSGSDFGPIQGSEYNDATHLSVAESMASSLSSENSVFENKERLLEENKDQIIASLEILREQRVSEESSEMQLPLSDTLQDCPEFNGKYTIPSPSSNMEMELMSHSTEFPDPKTYYHMTFPVLKEGGVNGDALDESSKNSSHPMSPIDDKSTHSTSRKNELDPCDNYDSEFVSLGMSMSMQEKSDSSEKCALRESLKVSLSSEDIR